MGLAQLGISLSDEKKRLARLELLAMHFEVLGFAASKLRHRGAAEDYVFTAALKAVATMSPEDQKALNEAQREYSRAIGQSGFPGNPDAFRMMALTFNQRGLQRELPHDGVELLAAGLFDTFTKIKQGGDRYRFAKL